MPRSMATPTSAGDEEGERQRDRQRPVEQPGRGVADDLLHDEGRVGAEHHHLAMRHVDDAHDAEGDGEADRGEQQHRAERDAVPDVLAGVPERQRAVDAWRSPLGAASFSAPSALASKAVSSDSASRSPRAAISVDRRELLGLGPVGDEHGGGARLLQPRLDARHRSPWRCAASSAAMRVGVGRLEHRLGGGEPHGRIVGAQQRQRAERVADRRGAGALLTLTLVDVGLGGFAGSLRRSADRAARPSAAGLAADEDRRCRTCGRRDRPRPAPQAAARRAGSPVAASSRDDRLGGREIPWPWRIWR